MITVSIPFPGGAAQVWSGEMAFLTMLANPPPGGHFGGDIAALNLLCAVELPGADGLDVRRQVAVLDEWTGAVARATARGYRQFAADPDPYDGSEACWRMTVLASVLQQTYKVGYRRDRIDHMDWSDSRDLFLHGLLGPLRSGTCPSLPVLLVAIGRRLGYPLHLVLAPGHVFSRWTDPATGAHLNLEFHGHGLVTHDDEHYRNTPVVWTPEMREREERSGPGRVFLRPLTPREELASFLALRGHVWESAGRLGEAYACYRAAAGHAPGNPAYMYFASGVVARLTGTADWYHEITFSAPA